MSRPTDIRVPSSVVGCDAAVNQNRELDSCDLEASYRLCKPIRNLKAKHRPVLFLRPLQPISGRSKFEHDHKDCNTDDTVQERKSVFTLASR